MSTKQAGITLEATVPPRRATIALEETPMPTMPALCRAEKIAVVPQMLWNRAAKLPPRRPIGPKPKPLRSQDAPENQRTRSHYNMSKYQVTGSQKNNGSKFLKKKKKINASSLISFHNQVKVAIFDPDQKAVHTSSDSRYLSATGK